jgi:adenine deaminase
VRRSDQKKFQTAKVLKKGKRKPRLGKKIDVLDPKRMESRKKIGSESNFNVKRRKKIFCSYNRNYIVRMTSLLIYKIIIKNMKEP